MGSAISIKLPKILLRDVYKTKHTISFNYKHFVGGVIFLDWPKEYANDFTVADNKRTRKRRLNGYRFIMELTITDMFLKTGAGNDYEQEAFEDKLNYLSFWEKTSGNTIMVYPYNDRSYVYSCQLDNYIKTPYQFDNGFKTKGHIYTISLSAKQLVTVVPEPGSRPWATDEPEV